jgi:site-specific DNA-methyltransferase (adenine-specific)
MKITENIQITNEDNMELMARYPDNYFELAIVDPPYGIGESGGKNRNNKKGSAIGLKNT